MKTSVLVETNFMLGGLVFMQKKEGSDLGFAAVADLPQPPLVEDVNR